MSSASITLTSHDDWFHQTVTRESAVIITDATRNTEVYLEWATEDTERVVALLRRMADEIAKRLEVQA